MSAGEFLDMSERGDLAHFVTGLGVRDARTVDRLIYMVEQIAKNHAARAWDSGHDAARSFYSGGQRATNPLDGSTGPFA